MEKIFDRKAAIENEFCEPLREVVAGFVPMGMTRVEVAETLDVDPRSLRTFCEKNEIQFPRNQSGRRDRIRDGSRRGRRANLLELDGRSQCLTAWAEEFGLKRTTLTQRMRRGKSFREALA